MTYNLHPEYDIVPLMDTIFELLILKNELQVPNVESVP